MNEASSSTSVLDRAIGFEQSELRGKEILKEAKLLKRTLTFTESQPAGRGGGGWGGGDFI